MPKKKAPADRSEDRHKDAGILVRNIAPSTLEAIDAEASARGLPRLDVLREWLDTAAAGVCPACKGSGRKAR